MSLLVALVASLEAAVRLRRLQCVRVCASGRGYQCTQDVLLTNATVLLLEDTVQHEFVVW